jgi:hypothetical protein
MVHRYKADAMLEAAARADELLEDGDPMASSAACYSPPIIAQDRFAQGQDDIGLSASPYTLLRVYASSYRCPAPPTATVSSVTPSAGFRIASTSLFLAWAGAEALR